VCILLAAAFLASASPALLAQGRGGGPPGGGQGGPPGGAGGQGSGGQGPGGMGGQTPGGAQPRVGLPGPAISRAGQGAGRPRGGIAVGPPGRWWDDKSYTRSLKLRPEQQARMDAIFEQNRATLTAHYDDLRQAETQMDQLSKAPVLNETALFAQIDRVKQARAELDKAYTHMLLQIRKELDPAQITLLEQH
jgi:Spy/CpxP family protein refolding chaperone